MFWTSYNTIKWIHISKQVVGNTTSGCFSPVLGQGLAFAYVPQIFGLPGTEFDVELQGHRRKAKVLAKPPAITQPEIERRNKMKVEGSK